MGPNGRRTPDAAAGLGRPCPSGVAAPSRSPPPRPRVEVRPATDADAPACAALHAGQISQGFLSLLGPGFLRRLYRRIGRAPGVLPARRSRARGRRSASSPARPTWPACTGASSGTTGSRPPSRRPAPCVRGWRRVLETLGHATSGGAGVGARGRAAGHRRRPGLAGPWGRAHAGRARSSTRSRPGRGRRPRGGRGGQPRRRRPLRAGRVRDRRALRAPRRHRVPAHAVGPSSRSTAGRCRPVVSGPLIAAVALAVTLVATPLVIVVAGRTGIVDRPGALKPQTEPGPLPGRGGGVRRRRRRRGGRPAVRDGAPGRRPRPRGGRRPLRPPGPVRLVGQVAVGVAVVVTCPVHLAGVVAAVLLVLAVTVLVINGVNLIDGLDMLAAGVAAVAAVGFAVVLHGPAGSWPWPCRGPGRLPRLQPAAGPGLPGRRRLLPAGHRPRRAAGRRGRPVWPYRVGMAALALVAVPGGRGGLRRRPTCAGPPLPHGRRPRPSLRPAGRPGLAGPAASLAYIGMEAVLAAGAVVAVHLGLDGGGMVVDVVAGRPAGGIGPGHRRPHPRPGDAGHDPDLPLAARGRRRGAAHAARGLRLQLDRPAGPGRRRLRAGAGRAGRGRPTPWPCPAGPPPSTWPCCWSGWTRATRCWCPPSPSWPRPPP